MDSWFPTHAPEKKRMDGARSILRGSCRLRGSGFRCRREDAQALDAAVGGGDAFHAQAGGFEEDDFAGHRNAALDLADQAAEGGGFVGFVEIAQGGLLAEEVGQLSDGKAAGNQPYAARFALRLLNR